MGEMVSCERNGLKVSGYLAKSVSGDGPLILVFHEWWGLVDHIKDVCDRYSREGFTAFAIDLYKGKTASDPENAGKLMTDLFQNRLGEAEEMIKLSLDYLKSEGYGYSKRRGKFMVGATGFCCGGTCTWYVGAKFANEFHALVPYYGLYNLVPIDFSLIKAPVLAIHAYNDPFVPLSDVLKAMEECNKNGLKAEFAIYTSAEHAFFNDTRPEVYKEDYASIAWSNTIGFFKQYLA